MELAVYDAKWYAFLMSSYCKNPLAQQIQELFVDSPLTPDLTALFLSSLDDVFMKHTIMCSDNLPAVVEHLYGIDDGNMYAVISVATVDEYKAVLIPLLSPIIRGAAVPVINHLKESGLYAGVTLNEEIKKLTKFLSFVLEVLTNSIKTKRKAIGNGGNPNEVVFPDDEVLRAFYECGRKVAYPSADTSGIVVYSENSLYHCKRCQQYHQGRTSVANAPVVPDEIMMSRYKSTWRRYKKI